MAQIKKFRQWGSITPGHPESELTPGVEVTSGPLGQGFANGVGMAMAEAYLAARYNKPAFKIIDHFTYGLVSDGDLMEGVASEAASLAGHLKLGKLIYLYDDNHMTLSASTQLTFSENTQARFDAYGWHTQMVEDGNKLEAIYDAILAAREAKDRPSLILVRTVIGYGSPHKENTFEVHGSPLGEEEVKLTKQNFSWPEKPDFYVPEKAEKHFRAAIKKGSKAEKDWHVLLKNYEKKFPEQASELLQLMKNELGDDWKKNIPNFEPNKKGMATREASGQVMQAISPSLPGFVGGSADLNSSTFTALINIWEF